MSLRPAQHLVSLAGALVLCAAASCPRSTSPGVNPGPSGGATAAAEGDDGAANEPAAVAGAAASDVDGAVDGDDAGDDAAVTFARLSAGCDRVAATLVAERALFDRPAEQALGADERARAWSIFADVLDHALALDALSQRHFAAWRKRPSPTAAASVRHLDLGFAASVEQLALGLEFVDRTLNRPQFEKLLDEGSPVAGVPAGAYARLKWNVVHVEEVAKTLAVHQLIKVAAPVNEQLGRTASWRFVVDRLEDRYAVVKGALASRAVRLFGGNGVDIGRDLAHAAWFPLQAGAAEWMGDTRVHRHTMLISAAQVTEAVARSEPGDVIVERRNWYLSNVGLPGFWPHAALWIGAPDELARWSADAEVAKEFGGDFSGYLEMTYPQAWKKYVMPDHHGNARRVLEAVSEGVVFSTAEESIRADYVAAMRPVRSKVEKARAIDRAFSYAGRPYDFDFDFYTDCKLVCSELVFKAYEPRAGLRGLSLGLEKVVGRMALGPNAIVRIYDLQRGTNDEQLAFGWFIDGSERAGTAAFADEAAFRASWKRPKWDIVQR
jgi:hypothetical protein